MLWAVTVSTLWRNYILIKTESFQGVSAEVKKKGKQKEEEKDYKTFNPLLL